MAEIKENITQEELKMLIEKWKPILEAKNAPKLDTKTYNSTAVILENEEKWIRESAMDSAASDMAQFTPILVPAVRRIFPQLLAHQIVGVQPLASPTGYAYALRYAYSNTTGNPVDGLANVDRGMGNPPVWASQAVVFAKYEPKKDDVIKDSAGTEIGTVVYAEENKALVRLKDPSKPINVGDYKIGTNTVTVSFVMQNEAGYNLIFKNYSGPYDTATGETLGEEMKTMKTTIERIAVEAKTRKLKAEYTFEFAQDLKAVHGLNAEQELINILEYEVTAEIDRELVSAMKAGATIVPDWKYANSPGDQGRWEMEKFRTLFTKITKEANQIAITTRRGTGNFIIASVNVVTALQNLSGFMYAGVPGDLNFGTGIMKVGTLDGKYTIFADTFATQDYVLVGYKGASQFDTGIIYCPYVPLMMQKVIDPSTFQPKIGFMTRYAIANNIFGTNLYYRLFNADFTGSSLA